MKTTKKLLALTLVVIMMVSCLVACGENKESAPTANNGKAEASAAQNDKVETKIVMSTASSGSLYYSGGIAVTQLWTEKLGAVASASSSSGSVENMKLFDGGKKAIVAIPRAVEDLIGVTEEDMDNISSYPRTVEGVCMAATLRQTKEGITKISLRAVPGYDAAAVCAHFGGGGHKGAAGGFTTAPLEEAVKQLEEIMLNM